MANQRTGGGRVITAMLAVALAGVSVFAVYMLRASKAKPSRQNGDTTAAEGGDNSVAELRDEVRSLRRQLGQVAGAQLGTAAPAAAEDASKPAAPKKKMTEEEVKEMEQQHSLHIATYSNAYLENEKQDPVWGPAREAEIGESFKDFHLDGFAFGKTECRATMCRTVVSHTETADIRAFGPEFTKLAPIKKMGGFFHYDGDKVIIYSPREGHDYPRDPSLAEQ